MVTQVDPVLNTKSIMERFSLKGKTSLVTGAGQGIGRALAHGLADAGADVAVIDLDLNLAEIVAQEITIRNPDVKVVALKADVTNPDQVTNMVDEIVKNWGSLTIACNNAGIGQWVDTLDMSYEDWQRMIRIDLDSVFLCAQAEARHMVKNKYGKIINTASMSGYIVNYPQDGKGGCAFINKMPWCRVGRKRNQSQFIIPWIHQNISSCRSFKN
jgi:NAD(P)-dependent dehydrogenase (short-subunit alcohol dehydrogenase family)